MQLNCDPSINAWIIANLNECVALYLFLLLLLFFFAAH